MTNTNKIDLNKSLYLGYEEITAIRPLDTPPLVIAELSDSRFRTIGYHVFLLRTFLKKKENAFVGTPFESLTLELSIEESCSMLLGCLNSLKPELRSNRLVTVGRQG